MRYILDENNNAVLEPDLMKWVLWFENEREKTHRSHTCSNGAYISTVFLGCGFDSNMLWETGLFIEGQETQLARFATMKEAYEFHDALISKIDGETKCLN